LATLGVDTHQIQYDLILVIKKATKLLMLKVRKVVVVVVVVEMNII